MEPEIDLYPDTETRETDPQFVANKFAVLGKAEEGIKLAEQGKIEEAINLYNEVQQLDLDVEINASNWVLLYFFGSLNNQAQDVCLPVKKQLN
ncbi:MAG: hypothetical protein MGF17_03810 [Trichodesmium sp. MAG_R04]|nr:hypothetical protein [Trichodesmium sp. MAG_R04]